jgi:4-oxalocrotonate tautomerase
MPMISVQMFPGRSPEQKEALVAQLTEAIVRTCDAKQDDVWVVIDEVARENWSRAGRMYSQP